MGSAKAPAAAKQAYRPAPEVRDVAAELIAKYHGELMDPEVAILFLFADQPKKSQGRSALAWVQKASGLLAYFGGILIADAVARRNNAETDREMERLLASTIIPAGAFDEDEEEAKQLRLEVDGEEDEASSGAAAPRFPAITPPAPMALRLPVGCVYGGDDYLPGRDFFIACFHYNAWHWALSRRQQHGLTDHELCHLTTEENERTGDLKLKLAPHVSEEFPDVIERHGAYLHDVDLILKAAEKGPRLTFAEISDRDADPPALHLTGAGIAVRAFADGIARDPGISSVTISTGGKSVTLKGGAGSGSDEGRAAA